MPIDHTNSATAKENEITKTTAATEKKEKKPVTSTAKTPTTVKPTNWIQGDSHSFSINVQMLAFVVKDEEIPECGTKAPKQS